MIEPFAVRKEKSGPLVSLALHPRKARRGVVATTSDHDQPTRSMLAGETPDVFSPCVAIDGGEVNAETGAIIVDPAALHEEVQVALTIRVADVPVDDAVVNDVSLELLAEADALPLDAVSLTIEANHHEQRAGRDGAPDVL